MNRIRLSSNHHFKPQSNSLRVECKVLCSLLSMRGTEEPLMGTSQGSLYLLQTKHSASPHRCRVYPSSGIYPMESPKSRVLWYSAFHTFRPRSVSPLCYQFSQLHLLQTKNLLHQARIFYWWDFVGVSTILQYSSAVLEHSPSWQEQNTAWILASQAIYNQRPSWFVVSSLLKLQNNVYLIPPLKYYVSSKQFLSRKSSALRILRFTASGHVANHHGDMSRELGVENPLYSWQELQQSMLKFLWWTKSCVISKGSLYV